MHLYPAVEFSRKPEKAIIIKCDKYSACVKYILYKLSIKYIITLTVEKFKYVAHQLL